MTELFKSGYLIDE